MWTMTAQMPDTTRSRDTLRRRTLVGMSLTGLLILVAAAFLFWQLTTLISAIRDLQVENERLTLALNTAQQVTSLMVITQKEAQGRIPSKFAQNVGAVVRDLKLGRDELEKQASNLPVGDPIQVRTEQVTTSLDRAIVRAEKAIHHAEGGSWFEVDSQVALLLVANYAKISSSIDGLVDQARQNYLRAKARADKAVVGIISVSPPLMIVALVIGAVVMSVTIRNVTLGVEQLSHSAQRLAEGYFDERVPVVRQDELGQLAQTFNAMAKELQDLYASLERQVAERTADLARRAVQLQAAAEVARDATAVLDIEELMRTTVERITERFGFHHAGIFLVDDRREYAVLRAASSEGGQRMLAHGHKLAVGKVGIVGYVAGTGEPRIALDVGEDAVFFDNPDLPQTRSEMALPLSVHGQVIGVLDVQSTKPTAFTEEDVATLQTMADQVTVALDNARLFAESQAALEEVRHAYGELSRGAWAELLRARPDLGYCSNEHGVTSAGNIWRSEMERALQEGEIVQGNRTDPEMKRPLAVPIKVRGDVIGVLNTYKPGDAGEWTPEEIALLETLAEQLGLALDSARLYQDTRRRAAREQLTREITEKMRSVAGVEDIIQTAVDELSRVLGTSRTFVRLGIAPLSQGDRKNES
jgi:GAF domain-containing protein/HAMP domain-containing protein